MSSTSVLDQSAIVKRRAIGYPLRNGQLGASQPYGFGWQINHTVRGHRMINPSSITGTEYIRFLDDKLTVIVLTNLGAHVSTQEVNAWGVGKGRCGTIHTRVAAALSC